MAEKVYTTEQVAEHLCLKAITIREYLLTGKLKGIRVGKDWRIPDTYLQEFIDGLKAADTKRGKGKTQKALHTSVKAEEKKT